MTEPPIAGEDPNDLWTDYCWPADVSCCTDWDSYDPAVQVRAHGLATSALRALTAYRVGGCPITVRPCRKSCWQPWLPYAYPGWYFGSWGPNAGWGVGGWGFWGPVNMGGKWINMSCGCVGSCSCTVICEIELPMPVGFIASVQIDDTVIPESWYRVDNNRYLVWVGDPNQPDMECGWPLCQDMNAKPGEDGYFGVTYLNALPVDGQAAFAAGMLACEFARAACGQACRLPPGVVQVTRQGVSYQVNPGTFPGGVTGIPEIDAWIMQVNPYHLKEPPTVWYPGMNQGRITTWSAP